ncbi:MAG: hypothetical protein GX054_02900, partial [Clostridiales bacterium]|nr:hypothetical protein [Clostridiales bacterium]
MRYKLPEGWKIGTTDEILEKIIDYRGKTPQKSETGIPTLSAKSVKNNYIDFDNVYYISKEEYKRFMTRGLPRIGDVVITTEAPLGFVTDLKTDNVALAQRILTIRGKKEIIDNSYLKYYFQSNIGQHELHSRATGTTVMGISQANFRKCKVIIPPLKEQKAIASTLSALDDKIEINSKIKDNLEAQAQAIFKHWFIDFEFPDENGNPYKSSGGEMVESELGMIPKGWEIVKLRDLAKRENGYSYKSVDMNEDSNNKLLTLKNFNRNGSYNADGYRRIDITDRVREHHYVKNGDILLACTDLTQDGDVVGNPIIYYPSGKFNKVIFSMDLVKLVPKSAEYNFFILYNLKTKHFKEYAKNHSTGTTVLHLQKSSIDNYDLLKPSN